MSPAASHGLPDPDFFRTPYSLGRGYIYKIDQRDCQNKDRNTAYDIKDRAVGCSYFQLGEIGVEMDVRKGFQLDIYF
jgi:hypothetical protein